MCRMTVLTLAMLAAAFATQVPGRVIVRHDAVPGLMSVQGYLTDDDGNPVSGPRSLSFRIYRGTVLQWQESQACTIRAGLFSVTLGRVSPLPDSIFRPGQERELELAVEGQALAPRVALTSTGFAFRAGRSDEAASVDRPLSPQVETSEIRDRAVTMSKLDQADALTGEVIKWTGTSWAPRPDLSGGPPSGSAGGDLAGTYPNPQVAGLRGRTVATTTPSTGQVLHWYSSQWRPAGLGGDLDGRVDAATVTGLQGRAVSTNSPGSGQVLTWYSSRWTPRSLFDGADFATRTGTTVLYPAQSPGRTVETFGSVRLVSGRARVDFDPSFAGLLEGGEWYVFLQQTSGEPVQAVAHKDASGFEVSGPAGSDAGFDWRAVGRLVEPARAE